MTKLYSYVLRVDGGSAPNPFWNMCTLTICKPAIRRTAQIGDWVIGTGSKNAKLKNREIADFSKCLVYAMKVTDKMTLQDYDSYCKHHLKKKIPNWKTVDWRLRVGDCIYDYSGSAEPKMRKGVHNEVHRRRDLDGMNVLLSKHFYYFGENPVPLINSLLPLIKRSQGHRIITQANLISQFENWIKQFKRNKLYADPQRRWRFDKVTREEVVCECSSGDPCDEKDECERTIC